MNPGSGMSPDIRDAPAYSFHEASRYLGIPQGTLRHWVLGRSRRPTESRPLIRAPSRADNKVSFNNLVEAHMLRALRAGSAVRMAAVRSAVSYAEDALGTDRLLLCDELRTAGQDIVLDRLASLTTLSLSGQLAMRRVTRDLPGADRPGQQRPTVPTLSPPRWMVHCGQAHRDRSPYLVRSPHARGIRRLHGGLGESDRRR